MMTIAEHTALRKYRDSIISRCAQDEIFARLCADAVVGLCACGAAVWVVCCMIGGQQ